MILILSIGNAEETIQTKNESSKHQSVLGKTDPSASNVEHMPEKAGFLSLIKSEYEKIKLTIGDSILAQQLWFIDKDKYLQQLHDEIESIKSCKSSISSSDCTNYTNDSGSFLMLEGQKTPFDYIRKAYVPFEEIDRCRVTARKLDKIDEYYGPYYRVPFAGQRMEMRQICLPKDKFFTCAVRSRYGIRNRLQVKVPGFASDYIGPNQKKFISQLATEWDEYYQNEIRNRPRVRKFKPRTILTQARESLRMKFHSAYIQEAIIERSVIREKEQRYAKEVEAFRDICTPLFMKWEEVNYRRYMRKMQEVKPYYELTDRLKKELTCLRNDYIKLDMDIIYTEDVWRRRTVLQNFHYLLKEQTWRQENDWIHRKPDNTLENFRESILKRPIINLRVRKEDTAWAVKEFYEYFFLNENARNVYIVFADPKHFLNGIHKLKMKSFMCLLELHFSMWVLANLEHAYSSFKQWSDTYIAIRQKFVKGRCSKQYFTEGLAADLKRSAAELMECELYEAVSSKVYRNLTELVQVMLIGIIPRNVCDNMKASANVVDKFTVIVNFIMDILGKYYLCISINFSHLFH